MISQEARALLGRLAAEGVSPWLSDGGRAGTAEGLLRALAEEPGFLGLFAGPAAGRADIRAFCDALRPVFEASGGRDGRVSVGLGERLADDAAALVAAAEVVRRDVARPNLLARIPATPAGRTALTLCLAQGISVDSTHILSVGRLTRVLAAYLDGMELALANGVRLERVAFMASLPVGMLDAVVNARLARVPVQAQAPVDPADRLRDAAALAVARLAYRVREERLDDVWWAVLRRAGAAPPRLAWTATRSRHITSIVGWNTVQAVSVEALETAAKGSRLRGDTLLNASADGHRALVALKRYGVDVAEAARTLEAAPSLRRWTPSRPDPGSGSR